MGDAPVRRVICTGVLAALVFAIFQPPAAAQGGSSPWDEPELIARFPVDPSIGSSTPNAPFVAIDAGGNQSVAWDETNDSRGEVRVARAVPGFPWRTPRTVASASSPSTLFGFSADAAGGLTAAFAEYASGENASNVSLLRMRPGGVWGSPFLVERGPVVVPTFAGNGRGDALIEWQQDFGTDPFVDGPYAAYAVLLHQGNDSAQVTNLTTVGPRGQMWTALADTGDAAIVWNTWDLRVNLFRQGTAWGGWVILEPGRGNCTQPPSGPCPSTSGGGVVASPGDRFLLAYSFGERSDPGRIYARWLGSGTACCGNRTDISVAGDAYGPRARVAEDGTAAVAWVDYGSSGSAGQVRGTTFRLQGGWAQPYPISSGGGVVEERSLALGVDSKGRQVAVWKEAGGLNAAYSTDPGTWSTPTPMGEAGGAVSIPRLAVAPNGDVLLAWSQSDGNTTFIWAARTTVARLQASQAPPPRALFSVTPTSGSPVTLFAFDGSSSFEGFSAGSLELRWDFEGDGEFDTNWSASPTASHRYGRAGFFRPTLEVRDALGRVDSLRGMLEVAETPVSVLVVESPWTYLLIPVILATAVLTWYRYRQGRLHVSPRDPSP